MFLFGTEVYTELFTILMLDCVIHNFWIPIFIIHHFLCKHHYSLYCLHHRMKEKWECKLFKSTDDQSTHLKVFFFQSSMERNWAIRNLFRWQFGGGHGDLRCCRGVAYLFCVAMRWLKSHLPACRVSDFKLTVFGEKKQLTDIIWL